MTHFGPDSGQASVGITSLVENLLSDIGVVADKDMHFLEKLLDGVQLCPDARGKFRDLDSVAHLVQSVV